jgi:hypothetical protein
VGTGPRRAARQAIPALPPHRRPGSSRNFVAQMQHFSVGLRGFVVVAVMIHRPLNINK